MADFVYVNPQIEMGGEVFRALRDIQRGIDKLNALHPLKNESIGKSQAIMMSVFGTNTEAEAQILADRWGAFVAAYGGDVPEWAQADPYALLRDLTTNTLRAT